MSISRAKGLTYWFCVTEAASVYCAVRTNPLYKTEKLCLKGLIIFDHSSVLELNETIIYTILNTYKNLLYQTLKINYLFVSFYQ